MTMENENKSTAANQTVIGNNTHLVSRKFAFALFFLGILIGLLVGGSGLFTFSAKPIIQELSPTPTIIPTIFITPSTQPTITATSAGIKNGKNIWVKITDVTVIGKTTNFVVDYLEHNPCWTPGGPPKPSCPNNSDYFLNKILERVEIPFTINTKVYKCYVDYGSYTDRGLDNNDTSPDSKFPLSTFLEELDQGTAPDDYYMDIDNNEITAIYGRCLP